MTMPTWIFTARYSDVERAYHDGHLTAEQWTGYRAIWRYSAPRFSDLVPLPAVRDVNATLDRGDQVQS